VKLLGLVRGVEVFAVTAGLEAVHVLEIALWTKPDRRGWNPLDITTSVLGGAVRRIVAVGDSGPGNTCRISDAAAWDIRLEPFAAKGRTCKTALTEVEPEARQYLHAFSITPAHSGRLLACCLSLSRLNELSVCGPSVSAAIG
jgi:hypothetical protein